MTALQDWVDKLPEEKKKGMKVVSRAQAGDMLRVDCEKVGNYTPRNSVRQHQLEDASILRICVCDSLMGCIAGYASFFHDFMIGTTDGSVKLSGSNYHGGMYIVRMAYDEVLEVDNTLAGDSSMSGEKWLVAYDEKHATYPGEVIGKIFIHEVKTGRYDTKNVVSAYTMYLEATQAFQLTPTRRIEPGKWKLIQRVRPSNGMIYIKQEPTALEVFECTDREYSAAKGMGLSMLADTTMTASCWL